MRDETHRMQSGVLCPNAMRMQLFTEFDGGLPGKKIYVVCSSLPRVIAHLNAAQILSGSQHSDFTTVVSHTAPDCTSRQTVKNVLAGRSRGVFQGKIEVARDAQKTDGYQMNQALLLSPYAEVDSEAGTGNLRRRREMQPRRDGRRA